MAERPPPLVLVAANTDSIRAELLRQLEDRGYRVAGAADSDEALALVRKEVPDVVLLDHQPPGLDGMAVLDRLRAAEELEAVPLIMVTHSSDPDLLVEALRRGAHDYLYKPYDPAELDARVMAALRVKRLHDALIDANRRLERQALTDDLTTWRTAATARTSSRARSRSACATAACSRSCASTSTTSRRSTTPTATRPATRC